MLAGRRHRGVNDGAATVSEDTTLVLLDVPHLRHQGRRLDLPNNLPGHLLAYLGLAGDWVTREALAALFWPERPEAEAQHNLRANLHRMKKQLEAWDLAGRLHVEQRRVRLALASDAAALRQAAGAGDWARVRALHRQPFLSGMSLAGFPALQEWLAMERSALAELLEQHAPTSVNTADTTATATPAETAHPVPRRLATPPLTGREAPLQALRTATAALLLVQGPPGIGKSRLLAEALPEAAWLSCRADRQSQTLAPLLDHLEDLQDTLAGRPGWAELAPAVVAGPAGKVAVQPPRLLAAAVTLLSSLGRPVVVDDLQWADPGTLELLRRLLAAGVPVRATLREHEPTPAVADWLALRDDEAPPARVMRITLEPLGAAPLAELIERLAGRPAPRFAAWLHGRCGGHPFLALEMLRALFASGRLVDEGRQGWSSDLDALSVDYTELAVPARIWSLLERRLAALPAATREVLAAAAVAGDARHPGLIAAVTGQSALAVGQALAEAQAASLLDRAGFAHALWREALLRRLPEPVHLALHAAWLQHGTDPAAALPPHRLAAHAWACADEAAAVRHQIAAAALDRRRGLHAAAGDALRSALDRCEALPQRAALQTALGRTLLEQRDFDAAGAAARAALGALPTPAVRQQALLLQADLAIQLGRLDEAERRADEAEALAPADRPLRQVLARLAFERGDFERNIALVQALLVEQRREPPDEALAQVLSTLGTGHDALGHIEQGLAFHEEALATARALGARHAEVDATVNLLWSLPDLGRHDEAIVLGEQALALGDYDGTPALLNNLAFLYWDRGRFDEAEPLYQRLSATEDPTVRCFAWAKLVALAARRGDAAACSAAIESALATLDQTEMYRAHAVVMVAVLNHGNAAQRRRARARWRPDQALDPSLQQQLDEALRRR